MFGELVVLDGSTFLVSDPSGDVVGDGSARGFFYADTRHLSVWQVTIDGEALNPLTSRNIDYYSARIVGMLGGCHVGQNPTLTVQRDRIVADGIHEDISVENHADETRQVVVEVRYAADFADLFEVKDEEIRHRDVDVRVDETVVKLWYEHDGFRRGTQLEFTADGEIGERSARFDIELGAHERWSVCIDVSCIDGERVLGPRAGHGGFGQLHPQMPQTLDEWIAEAPELVTDDDGIAHTYERSLLDLAALRFKPFEDDDELSLPAAGLPWFMALLGRDSVLTSYMALPFQPRLAAATLDALARLQAVDDDPFRDAEPGKIMHELRRGELTVTGARPHAPYYGSHDVTALFLVLLDEYERWTGDVDRVRRLEPVARAALAWIDGAGDRDGDGFLEYHTRSEQGLVHQGWKDSYNAILFCDGRPAEPPIATCEIQGYAFDARRRMARLARTVWDDPELADALDASAAALASAFEARFWCGEGGYPALALDGEKARVDALTSNIGHLLWSGILSDAQAASVARHVTGQELFSGWGVRTMSNRAAGFNPIEYHNGTVWPHDTAIIAEGLRRYGFLEESRQLAMSVFAAARAFDHEPPEVFAGFDRETTTVPVEYPTASRPQAWSSAAPLLALRTLLGLDVVDGTLQTDPNLPDELATLRVNGVHVRGRRVGT
jgi:glycogen debranching enzyme